MRKLLSANLARLRKERIFWLCIIAMLLLSAGGMVIDARRAVALTENYRLEEYYFNYAPLFGLILYVFISMFLGTEYSDGTIRNKLIVGHTRFDVYFANLTVCFMAGLCILAAWLLGSLVGIYWLGGFHLDAGTVLLYLLIAVFFTAALTGILVLLSMLCTNKAAASVLSILLYLGLLIAASMLYSWLCEPELQSGMMLTVDGIQMMEPEPNPFYLSGSRRILVEWLVDILPTGQAIRMANLEILHPLRELISSLLLALGSTVIGIFTFGKKDLK